MQKNYSILTVVSFALVLTSPLSALAATTPDLGAAATFGVLTGIGGTYLNTVNGPATIINGDLGYTTGPAMAPTVNGTTNPGTLGQARLDAAAALTALSAGANATCTENLGAAVNLSTVGSHPTGLYTPGVYCSTGAMTIGTGGVTLSGAGTYIFRAVGALGSVDNSTVTLANGASSCDVFWTPTAATTLGANTTFAGTIIDNANAITVGNLTTWLGRAFTLGAGSVGTTRNTITSACSVAALSSGSGFSLGATLSVVKTVVNDNGGTKIIADFPLFVSGTPVVSGAVNSFLAPRSYVVTETSNANYTQSFSGDCDATGHVTLNFSDHKVCIITNNDIGASAIPPVPPLIDVVKVASPLSLPAGPGSVTYTYTLRNIGTVPMSNVTATDDSCSPVTFVSGDTNNDSKLDVNETWAYRCATSLSETHTNTVTATGWANGISTVHIASATVVVGAAIVPPLVHVVKVPSVFTLPAVGGAVTYTYTVTNPGTVPLSNVTITDDKCTGLPGRVSGHPGDLNNNNLLESNEVWKFTCKSNLTHTTTNTATASGVANGLTARDYAVATVIVAAPGFPNTGLPSQSRMPWDIFITAGILMVVSSSLVLALRKR